MHPLQVAAGFTSWALIMFFTLSLTIPVFDSYASEQCAILKGDSVGQCMEVVAISYEKARFADMCGLVIDMDALRGARRKEDGAEYYYVIESARGFGVNDTTDCGLIVSDKQVRAEKNDGMVGWVLLSPVEDEDVWKHVSNFVIQNVSTEDVRLVTYRMEQVTSELQHDLFGGGIALLSLIILFVLICLDSKCNRKTIQKKQR